MEITNPLMVALLLLVPGFVLGMAASYFETPALNYVGLPAIVVGFVVFGLWAIQAAQSFG